MLAFIRFMLKVGMLFLLFPFRVFPIKRNRILLLNGILNFDGKYGCNPKYLTEYILKYYPNTFDTIYPLGKDGVSKNVIAAVNNALEAQELIKINVLKTVDEEVRAVAYDIASSTNAELIQIIGRVIDLYRKSKKNIYEL